MNQQEIEEAVEAKLAAKLATHPAGPSVQDVETAVNELAAAVEAMPAGPSPVDVGVAAMWAQSGRYQINRWTGDLRRSLEGVATAIEAARAAPLSASGIDAVENALWRLDTAREKVRTIACLTLGVPVMVLTPSRTGVGFKVDGKALGARLVALSTTLPVAGQLNAIMVQLLEHDATDRRNEISHMLTQVTDVPPLFYFQLARVDRGRIRSWETKSYHANAAPFGAADLTTTGIVTQTYGAIVQAFDLTVQAVDVLTQVVRAAGRLEPWDNVFYDEATGVATLKDPRSIQPGEAWPPAKG